MGAIAGELATIAAVADVAENVNTLQLLAATGGSHADSTPARVATTMRLSSITKWLAVFAATGVLSIMFFQKGGWGTILGLLYALSAVLGAGTVVADVARLPLPGVWFERLARTAFFGVGLALLIGLPVAASQL